MHFENNANKEFEPRCEKTGFLYMRKSKTQISFAVTLISAFGFATRIVQILYFLNPKCLASSHFLLLYSLVCVEQDRKPRRPVFSERGSNYAKKVLVWCHGDGARRATCLGIITDKQNLSSEFTNNTKMFPRIWFQFLDDFIVGTKAMCVEKVLTRHI